MFIMARLEKYYEIIERAISKIGVDPVNFRGSKPGEWTLQRNDYSIWVDLWNDEQEDVDYLQVVSPVMEIPDESQMVLFKDLLQINLSLCGVAFCVHGNQIVLKGTRVAEGLDMEEAYAMILLVSKYVSDFAPMLLEKYFNNGAPGNAPNTL